MTWLTWPTDQVWPGTPVQPKAATDPSPGFVLDKPAFDPSKPYTVVRQAERRGALANGAIIAIAPPIAVFMLGISLMWVVREFRAG